MKPRYIYLISIAVLIGLLSVGDRCFKLHHEKSEVYHLEKFRLNDSVWIEDAVVFTGKNIFGVQEAILVPGPRSTDEYLYLYLRFPPEWFETKLKGQLKTGYPKGYHAGSLLYSNIQRWSKINLGRFWHLNDFPLIVPNNELVVLRKEAKGEDLQSGK